MIERERNKESQEVIREICHDLNNSECKMCECMYLALSKLLCFVSYFQITRIRTHIHRNLIKNILVISGSSSSKVVGYGYKTCLFVRIVI